MENSLAQGHYVSSKYCSVRWINLGQKKSPLYIILSILFYIGFPRALTTFQRLQIAQAKAMYRGPEQEHFIGVKEKGAVHKKVKQIILR